MIPKKIIPIKSSNNNGYSLFEIIVAISLLSIVGYMASDLVVSMQKRNVEVDRKNALINIRTLTEATLSNLETCTEHFKGLTYGYSTPIVTPISFNVIYRDKAKTIKLLEVGQKPYVNSNSNMIVSSIKYYSNRSRFNLGNNAVKTYNANQTIIYGYDFQYGDVEVELVEQNNANNSIHNKFKIPVLLASGDNASGDNTIKACANSIYSLVKISKQSANFVKANCSDLNNATDLQKAIPVFATSKCSCSCATCPGGVVENGGTLKIDTLDESWMTGCSLPADPSAACQASIELTCRVTHL